MVCFVNKHLKFDYNVQLCPSINLYSVIEFKTFKLFCHIVQGVSTSFEFADKVLSVPIQLKATEKYFPVVMFMLYKVVLTFESVDKLLRCDC